ncbi:MAG: 2-hydroxychromene-2-carboxylate isomerase [Pseudomonadota bacterium]
MPQKIEFLFDFASPTTYLAHQRLAGIAERTGAEFEYIPVFLGGVMHATNNTPPGTVPAKGAYLLKDLQRYAQRDGVTLNFNPHFPVNTMAVLRMAVALKEDPRFLEFINTVFNAMWREPKNMADPEVIGAVLTEAGFDAAALAAKTQDQDIKDQLKANTEYAVSKGAFGAPTFLVGEEMFFGQDRTDWVETYAAKG